jgi:hypothetical protein
MGETTAWKMMHVAEVYGKSPLGKLLKPSARSTKGLNIYCRADTATQVEFHAYLGIIRRRVIIADATGNRAITLVLAGAEAIGDRTLEQAYAEECERYRAESEVA